VFANRIPEMSPRFLTRVDKGNDFIFEENAADGLWYRVIPQTAKEVFFIQFLPKGRLVLTPAKGDGILVRADAMPI
jgi:hypothetical protein